MKKQLFFLVALLCFTSFAMQAQQRLVLVEEFTASTCGPCATVNAWLNPLLVTNADKIVVVKYQMNWPGAGDIYYTTEGGTRRTFYGVSAVPDGYVNGAKATLNSSSVQTAINNAYAQTAQADIAGSYRIVGNMIYIKALVTPLISGDNHVIHCIVNEKSTTQNKATNGETVFHHVMMKMFPNGSGTNVNLTAGTTIPIIASYDMSTTHVEDMTDLEVVVFVQNKSTKAVLNAAYITVDNTLCLPPENFTGNQQGESLTVNLSWDPITGKSLLNGYNVYRDGVKLNTTPLTTTTYQDVVSEYGVTYNYNVSAIIDGNEGYWTPYSVFTNIAIPVPEITTLKQIRGKEMLVEWKLNGFEHPTKYYIYRGGIPQNPGAPTTETSLINAGISYREYCFQVEPILNAITGTKSASICVTLLDIPQPKNVKAEQVSIQSKEVLLTWNAQTTNTVGYNIYRDDVKINTELVSNPTYTDIVSEFDVEYHYKVFAVAETGAESEKNGEVKITLSNLIPAPANVKITHRGELKVFVEWDAVALSSVDGYNIFREGVKLNDNPVTNTNYSDVVPAEGRYCYTIAAIVEGTQGGESQSVCENIGLSINEKEALFSIFPNPVSGILNINAHENVTDCQIFNLQGQIIYSSKANVKEISTENWASGVYIIRITTEKGTSEKRFSKN